MVLILWVYGCSHGLYDRDISLHLPTSCPYRRRRSGDIVVQRLVNLVYYTS